MQQWRQLKEQFSKLFVFLLLFPNGQKLFLSLQFISLLFFLFLSAFPLSFGSNVETQALLEFKRQLKDPLNVLDSWKELDSPCMFSGITCDLTSGKVTEISLDNKSLSGEISPSISALESLTTLWLPSNSFSGKLPLELLNCSNLRISDMGRKFNWVDCAFYGANEYDEGEIPENIGNLKNLTYLFLADSHLRGEIPESIFGLWKLETLDISRNKISGNSQNQFPNCKSLQRLSSLSTI
ncbi:hypothetical protein GH714_020883 [Hevea brasiliensis]|uniref:Leucine-rich repeat-containing N-terminal plant-type domain-containing protein n=1 Tax=Hevea brasiliensis TaxID=3981 RepID=A0A6A6LB97_HEVBR|nr:hypothetical protein GH714_020883 [Hevea brasiliensis]